MNRRLGSIALVFAAASLSGCLATFDGQMDNNLACTVAKDKLFVVSEWGPVSIGTKIRKADTVAVCEKLDAGGAAPQKPATTQTPASPISVGSKS